MEEVEWIHAVDIDAEAIFNGQQAVSYQLNGSPAKTPQLEWAEARLSVELTAACRSRRRYGLKGYCISLYVATGTLFQHHPV